MGKKKQHKIALSPEEAKAQVAELRAEGDRLFASKDYQKAIDSYQQALKCLSQNHEDQPAIYSDKARCYLYMARYRDASNECTTALNMNPQFTKALQRRAVAFENMSLYKQALADIQALNRTNQSTEETQKTEQRLKDYVERGKKPVAAPLPNVKPAQPAQKSAKNQNSTAQQRLQSQQLQRNLMAGRNPYFGFLAKIEVADSKEEKTLSFPYLVSYADLYVEIRTMIPEVGPFVIKYTDADNDLLTMTSKQDVINAYSDALIELERAIRAQPQQQQQQTRMPTIKLVLYKVDEDQVVQPPIKEIKERQNKITKQQEQMNPQTPEELIEVENWVVEFAYLFRDQLKLEPNQKVDLQQIGWEKCQQALDEAIKSEKASKLFTQSIERFKELTAVGLFNWGVAQNYQVQRKMEDYIQQGGQQKVLEQREELYGYLNESSKRFEEALQYREEHFDSILAQAQLLSTKAKINLGFYLPLNTKDDEVQQQENGHAEDSKQKEQEKSDKIRAIQRDKIINLVKNIKEEDLQEAECLFKESHQLFNKALTLAKKQGKEPVQYYSVEQRTGENGEQIAPKIKKVDYQEQSDESEQPSSNVYMSWGNVLFEESLIYAGLDKAYWQDALKEAIEKFILGGAKEADIRAAMKIHTKKDEINYPQLQQKNETLNKEQAVKEEVKGLPSLKHRKKEDASVQQKVST